MQPIIMQFLMRSHNRIILEGSTNKNNNNNNNNTNSNNNNNNSKEGFILQLNKWLLLINWL